MGVKCSASSHKFRKVFPSALHSTRTEGWESEKHLMLWITLIRQKVRQPRFFFFLTEDLWCLYPSQVWWLVCYPGSPALPRHSGALPWTACPCWLREQGGEKDWAAGAVQFPLAGRPLQGHHWSEGKVLGGAKSLFCHSSSREIPAAGALTGSAENHISLRKRLLEGRGQQSVTHEHRLFPGRRRRRRGWLCWYRDGKSEQPQCKHQLPQEGLCSSVWGRWELSVLCCCWSGVSFGDSSKVPVRLWLGEFRHLATLKSVLLIREITFVLKNFLSECSGFILCKCKKEFSHC